jgi:hypothetical protein
MKKKKGRNRGKLPKVQKSSGIRLMQFVSEKL